MSAHSGSHPVSSSTTFVDKIDPFKKGSLKRKQRKSQGSSRYRSANDVELQPLPLLKGGSFGVVKENSQMDIASALRGFLFNGNDDDNEIVKTIPPPVKEHVTML